MKIPENRLAIALLMLLSACSHDESKGASAGDPEVVVHEIEGTRWALVRLGGESATVHDGAREPFIALQSGDGRAVGYAGCNRIVGGYELSGEQLRFKQMASTRMACPEMAVEDALLKALDATVRWSIAGDTLDLFDANGANVASFQARNL